MVWVLFWLLIGVLWRRSYLHNLHLEVCVEGHDTSYDLHGFFGLGYLPRCSISLTLDLRLVRDFDHWFVLMYAMWEMTWLLLYLFPLLVVENLGECWRLLMRVFLAGYWFMYCGCLWDYMDSLFWDVVSGLVIDLTLSFAVGASWYICSRYFSWGLWLQVVDWICWWCEIHLLYLWGMGDWMS